MAETGDMPRRIVKVGSGSVTSREGGKQQMGRTFVSVSKYHQGHSAKPTEYEAGKRTSGKPPTPLEMRMVFEENKSDYKIYKSQGMNDNDIYNILQHRT